jgi:hypothetical protein
MYPVWHIFFLNILRYIAKETLKDPKSIVSTLLEKKRFYVGFQDVKQANTEHRFYE